MKLKKRSYILLSVLVLFGVIFLFVARTLNRVNIEEKTHHYLETLSKNAEGNIIFESTQLKIFPTPHLSIQNILFILPGNARGTIETIEAYPKLLPLISGRIKISKLRFIAPDIKINYLPKTLPFWPISIEALKPAIDKSLKFIKKSVPDTIIQIKQGKIDIQSEEQSLIYLTGIDSTVKLHSENIRITVDCNSNLWQRGHISCWMNPDTYQGSGVIDVMGFNIKDMSKSPFLVLSDNISILSGDLNLTFNTTDLSEIYGNTSGSISNMIILPKNHDPLPIRCKAFNGNYILDNSQALIQMDEIIMTEPEIVLSGKYFLDKISPEVTLEVTGHKIDVVSVRKTALALIGKYKTTRVLFDYVRGGTIPEITFLGRAPTLKKFNTPGAIQLDGKISQGSVFIPKSKLDLEDVEGFVSVYKGNLIGKGITARLGNSHGTNGMFSIGLHGKKAPFFLEIQVDADLVQLPPILIRLIKKPAFQNEMAKVQNFTGRATGKLILGDRKNAVRPVVEISDFSLSTDYLRTPLRISLTGKKFVYNQRKIEITQASGSWGHSKFSGVSAVFDWQKSPIPLLNWEFENAQLVPDQIYPWLKSIERLSDSLSSTDSITGAIALSNTLIKGPLFHPGQWSYKTSGNLAGLTISSHLFFPDKTIGLSGDIKTSNNKIEFSNTVFNSADTMFTGFASLIGSPNHITKGEISISGNIGSRTLPWFAERLKLPFNFQKEIGVALSDFGASWTLGIKNVFSGRLNFSNGSNIYINGKKTQNRVSIESLTMSDKHTDARITFSKEGQEFISNFAGHLNGQTISQVIASDIAFTGTISGDFKTQLHTDHPINFCFEGFLDAQDLAFDKQEKFPFVFESLSMAANGEAYDIDTRFTFNDEGPHHVTGNIFHKQDNVTFDLDLDTRELTVDTIISYLRKPNPDKISKYDRPLYSLPFKGEVCALSQWVQFKNYQWSQVKANLRIEPDAIDIEVLNAALCNIQTPGHLVIEPGYMQMDFNPNAQEQKLEDTLPCLKGKEGLIEGDFELNGKIFSGSQAETLLSSIEGDFIFAGSKGRIYKLNVLSKLFALLNITEIFRGNLPDLAKEGFAYASMTADGTVEGTKIILNNAFIDGASMGIVVKGEIDTQKKQLDLSVLVAPLKTMDFIINQTPIVKDLIKGALVSIPIEIKGDMANPTIKTLAPADVDTGLLGILKNTLKLPVTIIQPLLAPDKNEEESNESDNPEN